MRLREGIVSSSLGSRLRTYREARGLSPATVDEYLGVMRGSCSNWENGYSAPEEELLEDLAGYYRVRVTELKSPCMTELKMPHSVENKAVGWYYSGEETKEREEKHTMARKTYTEEEKQAILKRAAETSALAASKEMGVSRAAIMKWQKEAKETTEEKQKEKKPRGRKKAAEAEAIPAAETKEAKAEKKPRGRKNSAEKSNEAPVEKKPRGRKKAAEKSKEAPVEKKPRGRKKAEVAAEEKQNSAPQFFIQSPFGHEISPEAIMDKIGEVDSVYVRVDQNKLYWVKGDENGAVDIW